MPHSLYLGSGIVQSRLHDFDKQVADRANRTVEIAVLDELDEFHKHQPSIAAINYCLSYSVVELVICLLTFALFVNSAILIVAGAALSDQADSQTADLFGIHDLLSTSLAPVAGTLFALALLFSGTSAGIVCTMAGQMVSEGALNWKISPWLRRLITRSISIVPAIIIAAAEGKDGLTAALNGTQIALSVALPFVSAPLIYFTCRDRYMTVMNPDDENPDRKARMRNSWYTTTFAVLIWLVMAIMNVALLVLVGLGKA
jgi:metal iron transporter